MYTYLYFTMVLISSPFMFVLHQCFFDLSMLYLVVMSYRVVNFGLKLYLLLPVHECEDEPTRKNTGASLNLIQFNEVVLPFYI